jgi:hypothetical protein
MLRPVIRVGPLSRACRSFDLRVATQHEIQESSVWVSSTERKASLGREFTAAAVAWCDRVRFRTRLADVNITVTYPRAIQHAKLEAVLSAMAHARDPDPARSARIALLAQMVSLGLDAERSTLYCDLVLHSLPEAARRALQAMDASKYQYQSEFARRYFGAGKAEGVAQGRVEIVLKQLATRYGQLSAAVAARVQGANTADLDAIAQRVLTAQTLDEALGTR